MPEVVIWNWEFGIDNLEITVPKQHCAMVVKFYTSIHFQFSIPNIPFSIHKKKPLHLQLWNQPVKNAY